MLLHLNLRTGGTMRDPLGLQRSPPPIAEIPADWLFAAAAQPVMIVASSGQQIVEVNPAAAALLGCERARLLGRPVLAAFDAASGPALMRLIASARLTACGNQASARIRAACGGARRAANGSRELDVTLSMVRTHGDSYFLVRLRASAAASVGAADSERGGTVSSEVLDALEQVSDGFVVTDQLLRLDYANRAFIRMAGLGSAAQLQGRSLAVWLELTQADLARLDRQMARRDAVSVWKCMLRAPHLGCREVEVSAVAVPAGRESCWGFRISDGYSAVAETLTTVRPSRSARTTRSSR